MSIKDDFIYLNTTKKLLKNEINKVNNVIDDDSTFRSYPQELFNGYLDILNNGTDTLWSNLEKVSQIGTEAVLENVENAPMKIELSGNTSQETTSGKNILPSVNLEEKTIDGVTFTPVYKNGLLEYININGTKESQQNVGYTISNVNFENGEEYTISGVIGFTSTTLQLFTNSSEAFPLGYRLRSTNGKETKTAQADEICSVSLYVYYGNTYDNVKVYPMICKNNTNDTYEPYTNGASPNPDYPQEVKVVKGENVVSVSGKNLLGLTNGTYSHNGITAVVSDGTITITGTATANSFVNIPLLKDIVLSNEQVTASINNATTISDTATEFRVYESGNNYIPVQFTTINRKTTTTKSGTFVSAYVRTTSGVSYGSGLIIKPQLELGSTATDFEEYTKTDYPISLGTLELCKIGDYKDYFHKDSGKWYVHKEIGKVVLDGSENWADRQQGSATYLYLKCTLQNGANGGISNKFKYNQSYNAPEEHILVSNEWKEASIVIRKDRLSTPNVANFKSWLSNNNVTLYYVLATPTEEEITNTTLIEQLEAIANAKSVKEKTYVTQTNDELPFILDVEAIKKYEVA